VAGACAGGVACSACYPLDLIRTRLTIQDAAHKEYDSIADAFGKIARREGFLGLYKGLGTTLMVAVPNLAISYCIYGTMKEFVFHLKYPARDVQEASEEEPHFVDSLVCGATSGICSSLITYPADVLRRRLQVRGLQQRQGTLGLDGVGPWSELKSIIKSEGPRGLYRGLLPEILKVVPMVATTFTTYEILKEKLGV
jgi:solute carrier family 25 (mitochondrial phosphate transporter), member 23/24/25/41